MRKKPNGFSLLEVLISLFILSFILLGFEAMQIAAMRDNQSAYLFNSAITQLKNMTERLHALEDMQDFSEQLAFWNKENASMLPKGIGEISGSYPNYTLTLYWGKKNSL